MHPAYDKATLTIKCQLQKLNRHQIKSHTNSIYPKKLKNMKVLEANHFLSFHPHAGAQAAAAPTVSPGEQFPTVLLKLFIHILIQL